VAAPTAGLHLTNALLGRLAIAGHDVVSVTLHVGLGTFQPVQAADLDVHKMHEEAFAVTRAAALTISRAKQEGRPIVAVGTTVVRALEAAAKLAREAGAQSPLIACSGTTKLLLQPGARLQIVDGLLTNFHLPRSTLLALVGATVGLPNLRRVYEHAIAEKYRFYSYGDAMLVKRVVDAEDVARHLVPMSDLPPKPVKPPQEETP
jgi:S-adenosylmethionine:tRNA ribosyltransferase-isomerase